jgi:hypothetical protein
MSTGWPDITMFDMLCEGKPVKVSLPMGGFWVGPGVDPARPKGYRVTYYWSCHCCARTLPNVELANDLCSDCRRDGAV